MTLSSDSDEFGDGHLGSEELTHRRPGFDGIMLSLIADEHEMFDALRMSGLEDLIGRSGSQQAGLIDDPEFLWHARGQEIRQQAGDRARIDAGLAEAFHAAARRAEPADRVALIFCKLPDRA